MPEITRENYLEKLKNLKKSSWLTYQQLADITKLDIAHVYKVINGNIKRPGYKTIQTIYDGLKTNQVK